MMMRCGLTTLPEIDRAGEFPLLNPVSTFFYRSPTHALHLYAYDGILNIAGEKYRFRAGDITCTPAGTEASYQSDHPGRHWVIHFFDPLADGMPTMELPVLFPLGKSHLFVLEQFKLISQLFNGVQGAGARHSIQRLEATFRLKALLLSIHNLASNNNAGKRSASTFSWEELLELIHSNVGGRLTLPWLAEKMNISSNTLSKKFHKHFGRSILQYILHYRIDKAKSLLGTTTLTIGEVGKMVGIPDPQYFNKLFRRVSGMNPSRYRDENKPILTTVSPALTTKDGAWREDR